MTSDEHVKGQATSQNDVSAKYANEARLIQPDHNLQTKMKAAIGLLRSRKKEFDIVDKLSDAGIKESVVLDFVRFMELHPSLNEPNRKAGIGIFFGGLAGGPVGGLVGGLAQSAYELAKDQTDLDDKEWDLTRRLYFNVRPSIQLVMKSSHYLYFGQDGIRLHAEGTVLNTDSLMTAANVQLEVMGKENLASIVKAPTPNVLTPSMMGTFSIDTKFYCFSALIRTTWEW
jgi:hypothetical protein